MPLVSFRYNGGTYVGYDTDFQDAYDYLVERVGQQVVDLVITAYNAKLQNDQNLEILTRDQLTANKFTEAMVTDPDFANLKQERAVIYAGNETHKAMLDDLLSNHGIELL